MTTLTDNEVIVQAYALSKMQEHGLIADGWTFGFDNAKTRFGRCHYTARKLTLTRAWVAVRDLELSRTTVLHEIAHALTDPSAGHNAEWMAKARSIGYMNPTRCGNKGGAQIASALTGVCACGAKVARHKRPTRVQFCGNCSRKLGSHNIITWLQHGRPVEHLPAYRSEYQRLATRFDLPPLGQVATA